MPSIASALVEMGPLIDTSHRVLFDWVPFQHLAVGRKEGRKYFIERHTQHILFYGYMASDIIMVKDHSDSERKPAATTWATLFD